MAKGFPFATNCGLNEISGLAVAKGCSKNERMKIGYARVSSGEQNLDLQRDALTAAGCGMIHEDEGVSGVARRRPGLDQALATLKQGEHPRDMAT